MTGQHAAQSAAPGIPQDALRERIVTKTGVGAVIGLGYVGLPLVQHLCNVGYRVLGFDVDPVKVTQLSQGESYIKHIDAGWIAQIVSSGQFAATTDFSRLKEADCISICVPTPLDEHAEPDLRYVINTTDVIAEHLRPGQLVILESTTYPGTTEELMLPVLNQSGLEVGRDYFLAFSPEREDPGNPTYTIRNIPKVIGGITPACSELAGQYYGTIFDRVVRVGSPAVAELTKLLENIFRSVNIALVNELKMLCDRMGIDAWEVIDAAATKPFGFTAFYPGPGIGGHCIPVDPYYLTWRAREFGLDTRFIELAGQINSAMPAYVVQRLASELNKHGKCLQGANILCLGVAYKRNVDDLRESPALEVIEILRDHGAHITYHDPFIPVLPQTRRHKLDLKSVPLTPETLRSADAVLILTDHDSVDYGTVVEHAPLVVDTRNATRSVRRHRGNVARA